MKKKLLAILLAGTMAVSMAAPAFAVTSSSDSKDSSLGDALSGLFGEGGALSGLFAEDSPVKELLQEDALGKYIPDGVDVNGLIDGLGAQLADKDSALYKAADGLLGQVVSEDGTLDLNKAGDLAEGLIGSLFGGESGAASGGQAQNASGNEMSEAEFEAVKAAVEAYVKEQKAAYQEAGDVQILVPGYSTIQPLDDGTVLVLGYFMLENYIGQGTDLASLNSSGEDWLLLVNYDGKGGASVIEATVSEDGEGYTASVEKMCAEAGITLEDYYSILAYFDINVLGTLITYLENHPEVTRIEYMGEYYTKDDLDKMASDYLEQIFSQVMGSDNTAQTGTDEAAAK